MLSIVRALYLVTGQMVVRLMWLIDCRNQAALIIVPNRKILGGG